MMIAVTVAAVAASSIAVAGVFLESSSCYSPIIMRHPKHASHGRLQGLGLRPGVEGLSSGQELKLGCSLVSGWWRSG